MFHVKLESLTDDPVKLGRLSRYEAMLRERAVPVGLVARSDRDRLVERHIGDSLRALPALPDGPAAVADLGSGAGLPGIPIAIARPDLDFALIESRSRKAAFLEWVVDGLGLPNVRVVHARIEDVNDRFAACLARALAEPVAAWRLALCVLRPTGALIYFGGASWTGDKEDRLGDVGATVQSVSWGDDSGAGPIVVLRRADLE
jgi:16S rRNA (guanine527-N7)-methyltransferase